MVTVRRLYVDTNVFIRLFEGSDELVDHLRDLFLAERNGGKPFLTTSELTLAELLVNPYRRNDDKMIQIYDNWTLTNSALEVGPVNRYVLWYAAVLRSQFQSLKLPDAIHLSTAIGFGCSHFLTADKGIDDHYELMHQRFGSIKGPVRIDILRPEIDVVKHLVDEAGR